MDDVQVTKTGLISLISIITYLAGRFDDLFWIVLVMMLIDYATGIGSAIVKGNLSSKIGLTGIIKKIMYIITILFAFVLDLAVKRVLNEINIDFDFKNIGGISIGTIVIIFYIGNEAVSIIENLSRMGSKTPKFLMKIAKALKEVPNEMVEHIITTEPKEDLEYEPSNTDENKEIKSNTNDENKP